MALVGGSGGLFVFDGLQFGGIVIVGCCDCGWRWLWLWLWMCGGFHGYDRDCYGWLWLFFIQLGILFYYVVYIILMY